MYSNMPHVHLFNTNRDLSEVVMKSKMRTRNIPGGKGGRCVRLTTSPPSRAECHEIREPKPHGTLWATPGPLRDCLKFTFMKSTNFFIFCTSSQILLSLTEPLVIINTPLFPHRTVYQHVKSVYLLNLLLPVTRIVWRRTIQG